MKKIIFFAKDLNVGGIETSLVNLLNELSKFYNTTLVLEKNEGPLKRNLSNKVKIIEHKISESKITILRKGINFTKRVLFTLKYKNKYDFSCAYTTYLYSSVKLSRICSNNNVIYVHSDYTNLYNEQDFRYFFDSRFINDFRKIIFVSNESKKNFCKYYKELEDKTLVINNIVNVEEIINKSKELINIKISKQDIIFTFVARLVEESKKISRLLECFKILISKNKNIKLWIIGDGEEYEKTKEFIKTNNLENNILMIGLETNPYKYISKSNYFILTSDYEGFPVVFNESNILGKPIFSTLDISDDYFNLKNELGFIIPKDPELMSKEILNIIKTEPKVKKLNYAKLNKERIEKIKKVIENEI